VNFQEVISNELLGAVWHSKPVRLILGGYSKRVGLSLWAPVNDPERESTKAGIFKGPSWLGKCSVNRLARLHECSRGTHNLNHQDYGEIPGCVVDFEVRFSAGSD